MTLSFPLNRPGFMNKLKFVSARFEAPTQRQATGLGGGEVLSAEIAPALWQGQFTLASMSIVEAAEIRALLSMLEVPGRAFFAYHPDRAGPALDSDGSIVSGHSPVISDWDANDSTINLSGLPDGYVISPGDMVSWEYGTSPVRYALHRFVEGATVSAGVTGDLQVYPHIRGTISADEPVHLRKPFCKAIIVPGSTDFGVTQGRRVTGVSFSFRQSLR